MAHEAQVRSQLEQEIGGLELQGGQFQKALKVGRPSSRSGAAHDLMLNLNLVLVISSQGIEESIQAAQKQTHRKRLEAAHKIKVLNEAYTHCLASVRNLTGFGTCTRKERTGGASCVCGVKRCSGVTDLAAYHAGVDDLTRQRAERQHTLEALTGKDPGHQGGFS
jgi:hypothetical protein